MVGDGFEVVADFGLAHETKKNLPSSSSSNTVEFFDDISESESERDVTSPSNTKKKWAIAILLLFSLLAISVGLGTGLGLPESITSQANVQVVSQATLKQCLDKMNAIARVNETADLSGESATSVGEMFMKADVSEESGEVETKASNDSSRYHSYSGDELVNAWSNDVGWVDSEAGHYTDDDYRNVRRSLKQFELPPELHPECTETLAFMLQQPVCEKDPPKTLMHKMSFELAATGLQDPNFDSDNSRFEFGDDKIPDLQKESKNIAAKVVFNLLKELGVKFTQEAQDIMNGIIKIFTGPIDAYMRPVLNIGYGVYYQVTSIGKGTDVEVKYPVNVEIEYPSANSFKCGDKIQIKTTPRPVGGDSARLDVNPSSYEMELGLFLKDIKLQLDIGLNIDVINEEYSFSKVFWEEPFLVNVPLINLCQEAFAPGASLEDLIGCGLFGELKYLVKLHEAYEDYKLNDDSYSQLIEFEKGTVTIDSTNLPDEADEASIPEMIMKFSDTLKSDELEVKGGSKLKASGEKEIASAEIDLLDVIGMIKDVETTYSLFDIITIDFGDISPDISVKQKVAHEFEATIFVTFNLVHAMEYEVSDENDTIVESGSSREVKIKAGHSLFLSYPQELQEVTNVINSYSIDGQFKLHVKNNLYKSFNLRLFEIEVEGLDDFTLLEETGVMEEEILDKDIENHRFSLSGEEKTFPQSPITLDPERPVLELDLQIIRTLNIGGGEREVTLQVDALNSGDVPLCDLLLSANISPPDSFGECLLSPDFVPNPSLGDNPNGNLLAPGQGLDLGQGGFVQVSFISTPDRPDVLSNGCFDSTDAEVTVSTQGFGTSPIGTRVEDGLNECTGTRRTERNEATANLGSREVSSIKDFALYAYVGMELSAGMAPSTGDVGSNQDLVISPPPCDTNVGATADNPGELRGTMHVKDDLTVEDGAHFVVDYLQIGEGLLIGSKAAKAKAKKSSSTSSSSSTSRDSTSSKSSKSMSASLDVLGATSEDSDCVKTFNSPFSKSSKNNSKNRPSSKSGKSAKNLVISGDEQVLPGKYNEIVAEEGATLRLVSGNYSINKLAVESDVTIVASVPSDETVSVDIDKWDFHCGVEGGETSKSSKTCSKSSKANVRKLSGKSMKGDLKECSFSLLVEDGLPSQLMVHYYGDSLTFEGATLQVTLNATGADVSLVEGSILQGGLYADTIFVGADSSFIGNRELVEINDSLCDKQII
mmetsp:Transcript_16035/g.27301  ORF Transcript_16035/g.27301 Transcript_16035/m.27301 type:complete len:1220 (-) Transcript_16035:262-3921(-)|eukprot:CAMPEP_0183717316 /NCGR_PEP_ID=MMETSP0737-20130205/10965_1 /TAXON_ID=385413 /ORGANISM="Thalassiosira miniscula, Strain CCMP1093" /LENGTH=1219 /DNA_ID=CAMNT_0025946731 /DNA_START=930 /DNA_END=4589 /DNA_ORIENTATION=+